MYGRLMCACRDVLKSALMSLMCTCRDVLKKALMSLMCRDVLKSALMSLTCTFVNIALIELRIISRELRDTNTLSLAANIASTTSVTSCSQRGLMSYVLCTCNMHNCCINMYW